MGPGQAVAAGPRLLQDLSALAFWCSKNVSGDRVCPDVPQPAWNWDCWETSRSEAQGMESVCLPCSGPL